jgi:hypothetical protein
MVFPDDLAPQYREAWTVATELAAKSQATCNVLFLRNAKGLTFPIPDDLEPLHQRCIETYGPLCVEIAIRRGAQLVEAWDGFYATACEALLSFTCRVRAQTLQIEERNVRIDEPPFFSLQPPKRGYFRKLIDAEFALLVKPLSMKRPSIYLDSATLAEFGIPPYTLAESSTGQPQSAVDATLQSEPVDWTATLAAVADENAIAIIKVAEDPTKTTDEKMRAIYAIDSRAVGWDSPRWAKVLQVTPPAIRQTDWWRQERKRLRG